MRKARVNENSARVSAKELSLKVSKCTDQPCKTVILVLLSFC